MMLVTLHQPLVTSFNQHLSLPKLQNFIFLATLLIKLETAAEDCRRRRRLQGGYLLTVLRDFLLMKKKCCVHRSEMECRV